MKVTVEVFSLVHVTGDVADARRRCEAYLYSHTRIADDGEFDNLDDGDNGGAWFVLATSAEVDMTCGVDNFTACAQNALQNASDLSMNQRDRFWSGLYPCTLVASESEARRQALDAVLS